MVFSKHQFIKLFLQILFMLAFSMSLFGCSGGNSEESTTTPVDTLQGVLVDSAVEGVRFESPTMSGLTDSTGTFTYRKDEVVSFFIGDILLGSSIGADIVTPIDFVAGASDETNSEVTNILRFIQSLDSDSDPNNGIHIDASTRTALAGQVLDFSLPEAEFEMSFNTLSGAVLGSIALVSVVDAREHFVNAGDFFNGSLQVRGVDLESIGLTKIFDSISVGKSINPTAGAGYDRFQVAAWTQEVSTNSLFIVNFSRLTMTEIGNEFGLVMELRISISPLNVDFPSTENFNYILSCIGTVSSSGCGNMTINHATQSISFNNAVLLPDNSKATAPVTFNGALSWEFF